MDIAKAIIVGICGVIAVYVGIRIIVEKCIPVVYEGDDHPLAWIKGWESVLLGFVIGLLGVVAILNALGIVRLF